MRSRIGKAVAAGDERLGAGELEVERVVAQLGADLEHVAVAVAW